MSKITVGTLKSLARKGKLYGKITMEFSGMTDSMENVEGHVQQFSVDDVARVIMTKNYINRISDTEVTLSNCCYKIVFNF